MNFSFCDRKRIGHTRIRPPFLALQSEELCFKILKKNGLFYFEWKLIKQICCRKMVLNYLFDEVIYDSKWKNEKWMKEYQFKLWFLKIKCSTVAIIWNDKSNRCLFRIYQVLVIKLISIIGFFFLLYFRLFNLRSCYPY